MAIITGGGRGIGRDIALGLCPRGRPCRGGRDRSRRPQRATAKDAGGKSIGIAVDVAKSADINRMVDEDHEGTFGRIDIVVNNAMKIVPGKLEALPEAAWDTTMNIGLKGAFLMSQAGRQAHDRAEVRRASSTSRRSPACFRTTGPAPTAS